MKIIIKVTIAIVLLLLSWKVYYNFKEIKRLNSNSEILLQENGKLSNEAATLLLNTKELKIKIESDATLARLLKDSLKIKAKRINELTSTVASLSLQINTKLRDSTIITTTLEGKDSSRKVQTFTWNDNWTVLIGIIDSADVNIQLNSSDSLYIIRYKGKLRFNSDFPWLKRDEKLIVKGVNPNMKYLVKYDIKKVK